jgi:hypothetical protein
VTGSEPYIDEFGDKWDSKVAHFGVALKFECPNGKYVSTVTGLGSQGMSYQVLPTGHPPLPWPPDPHSTEYSERCRCDVCAGRLVGDTVAAIIAEADEIHATMKSNEDTYTLKFLESARELIFREAQLGGYGINHNPVICTDIYVGATRRVHVLYNPSFQEVEAVTVSMPGSDLEPEEYPDTVAGAVAALRGP